MKESSLFLVGVDEGKVECSLGRQSTPAVVLNTESDSSNALKKASSMKCKATLYILSWLVGSR